MNWKDCIKKLSIKRKTDNLLWSEMLSVQSTSCTLTSADSATKLIDFLILKATAAKYLIWSPICHRGFPEKFQQRLTTPDLNQVPSSSHCLRHPQSQCFSRSRDLVVDVVVVVVIAELIKQKLWIWVQFISGCQIDKFGRRKRLAIGQIWKRSFLDYYYINLEVVTVYLRDITHPSQSL